MSINEGVPTIKSREALMAFADEYKLREDWHEPDERDISAKVYGSHLDNAMSLMKFDEFGHPIGSDNELTVVLLHDDQPVAQLNLAWLLSWACRAPELPTPEELRRGRELAQEKADELGVDIGEVAIGKGSDGELVAMHLGE